MALALPTRDGCYARHGDLHMGNILADPETKELTGIVDFGKIEYREKAHLAAGQQRGFDKTIDGFYKIIELEYERRKDEIPDLRPAKKSVKAPGAAC